MAATSATAAVPLTGLARRLVADGILAESDARKAHEDAQQQKIPLISFMVQNQLVDSIEAAMCAASEFGLPLFDISALDLTQAPVKSWRRNTASL